MSFVLRMALREIRASWQRLLFFFICIAVGVASIVAIRSVIQSVREGLTREARAHDRRPTSSSGAIGRLDDKIRAAVEQRTRRADVCRSCRRRSRSPRWCGRPTVDDARDGRTPRGRIGIPALRNDDAAGGRRTRTNCCADHGALVRPELLAQLNLRDGRRPAHRDAALPDSRRDRERTRTQPGRVLARLARVHRLRGSARRPVCCRSAAAPRISCCCRCRARRTAGRT